MRAALQLAKILVTASCRSSKTGPSIGKCHRHHNRLKVNVTEIGSIAPASAQWCLQGTLLPANWTGDRAYDCFHDRLFRYRSKLTSKLRVTGLCEGNSPVTGEFPAQRGSNAENVSIWWRHHALIWENCQSKQHGFLWQWQLSLGWMSNHISHLVQILINQRHGCLLLV